METDRKENKLANVQETIKVPNYVSVVAVLGPKDAYLNKIRKKFQAKISFRDGVFYCFGDPEEIGRIRGVLTKIFDVLGNDEKVTFDDIDLFIRQSESGSLFFPDDGDDILFAMGRKKVRAKSQKQIDYMRAIENSIVTFAVGTAGSAKTYLATIAALKAYREGEVSRIVVSRPNIALDGMHVGFLPGDTSMKLKPYVAPIFSVLEEFMSRDRITELMENEVIQTLPLEFIRGYSFKDTFIIIDEAQNLKTKSFLSILTRLGPNSKMVICGDTRQSDISSDLMDGSGLERAAEIMEGAEGVSIIRMGLDDVVRSGLTLEVIRRFDKYRLY